MKTRFDGRLTKALLALLAGVVFSTCVSAGFRDERTSAKKPEAEIAKPLGSTSGSEVANVKVVAQPVKAPEPAPKKTWSLSTDKTLRDNLDEWLKIAGWNPIIWDASNHYQVRLNTSSIEGDFPEVLKQVSSATGLNICAKRRDKYVRVTDRGVSCKEMN